MPAFLFIILVGAAAGFVATRIMKVETDVLTTVAIGIFGAIVGGVLLRLVLTLTGPFAAVAAAIGGAVLLIWLWQRFWKK